MTDLSPLLDRINASTEALHFQVVGYGSTKEEAQQMFIDNLSEVKEGFVKEALVYECQDDKHIYIVRMVSFK